MSRKVTIIGAGSVVSTIAFMMAVKGIAAEIVIIDINEKKALGEAMDILQGIAFCDPCKIYAGTYADATTAKIAVVTGKAVGPAYMALTCADFVIAAEGCTIAPLEPETAVTVLHKEEIENSANIDAETKRLAARYAADECSAAAALRAGTADAAAAPAEVRGVLERALDMLSTKRLQRLPKKHGNLSL